MILHYYGTVIFTDYFGFAIEKELFKGLLISFDIFYGKRKQNI
jgi:hypothetical protein